MTSVSGNAEAAIMKMARKTGVVRAREIRKAGLHPEYCEDSAKAGAGFTPTVDYMLSLTAISLNTTVLLIILT
ncbi:MAG: hypothetical protein JSV50_18500 [Desulfobacteraceae bacterium]|nr:MAG: hypothetical protein JSV50_18500 [Desulfobacteraceae bacterium]